jgi:hypothetical protein
MYTITPGSGYYISSILVDGSPYGSPTGSVTTYTFTNVVATHTIAVTFALNPVITVTSPTNGVISPGTVSVTYGGSQTFTITPNSGYDVSVVTVDGISQGAITSYPFTNVIAAHTISATFVKWGKPTVTAITPTPRTRGATYTLTVTGTNFHTGATVNFGTNTACTTNAMVMTLPVTVNSLTSISGSLTIPGNQNKNTYYVCVANTDGQSGYSATKIFTVQ